MFERLDAVTEKYEELTTKLSDPEVLADYNTLKKLSKEQKQDKKYKYLQQENDDTAHNSINHVVGGGIPKDIGKKAKDKKSKGTGCCC